MKRAMMVAMLAVQGFLVSTAAAHPGPPGHIHGDDWPFGLLAVGVAVVLGLGAWRKGLLGR